MKSMARPFTGIICCLFFLVGCSEPNIQWGNDKMNVAFPLDRGAGRGKLAQNSPSIVQMKSLVMSLKDTFQPSLVSFVPLVYFGNKSIEVLFLTNAVVIECDDGTGHCSNQWVATADHAKLLEISDQVKKDLVAIKDLQSSK
jgi:hypothetical protein